MENTTDLNHLKFPIGPFFKKDEYSSNELKVLIEEIERAPVAYKRLSEFFTEDNLSKTYRPGGWNVKQLIHHVADIQMLHFFRMKRAITEADYTEVTLVDIDGWANTKDGLNAPVEDSLLMLEGITKRYIYLIRSLSERELALSYYHPVRAFDINQKQAIAMSAWHLSHHLAHVKLALNHI
ncbi:DinB family protein [Pedobacter sp. MC2016-14]|uniref:DinB family protein n=1 Tax=Pedobacter sp. MC2016-14 TaxID=2897327 RepID=UPI001E6309B5|nr:DinB family protein [Pedobacter sp. MC2016-14]MCD0487477.1 DinB family protein [Pedobacter sp. MC2016-14]